MKVYIVLEHQLNENNRVMNTDVVKVYSDLESAQAYAEDCGVADKRYRAKYNTDPCVYKVEEFDVI